MKRLCILGSMAAAYRPADLMKFNSRSWNEQRKLGTGESSVIVDTRVPIAIAAMEVNRIG
jgi:hypothetical protein